MTYPPAPWQLHGQLWVSLFRVRAGDHADRPAGLYGVALVSYEDPSPLVYSELLVARRRARTKAHITDIWVDSADSRDGGRELWAIPKDLCELDRRDRGRATGRGVQRTSWTASLQGRRIADAAFTDLSRVAPRTPFRGGTWQQRQAEHPDVGEVVTASLSGSARTLPCRSSWVFDDEGPLAWLAGKRPLASFRMADFQMSFG